MQELAPIKSLIVLRRFIELIVPTILLSLLLSALNVTGLVTQRTYVILATTIFGLIFSVFNFFNLQRCYIALQDKKLYFSLNLLTQLIFAAVNFICYGTMPKVLYGWLFSVTKLLNYLTLGTVYSSDYTGINWVIYSIILYHVVGIITIFVATIGSNWIFEDEEIKIL